MQQSALEVAMPAKSVALAFSEWLLHWSVNMHRLKYSNFQVEAFGAHVTSHCHNLFKAAFEVIAQQAQSELKV